MLRALIAAGRIGRSVGVRPGLNSGLVRPRGNGLTELVYPAGRLCSAAPSPKWTLDEISPDVTSPTFQDAPNVTEAATFEEITSVPEPQDEIPVEFSNLPLSESLKKKLRSKNIEKLFPVQEQCFAAVMEEKDLIVRSRTGTGKTLAFALPIVSKLTETGRPNGFSKAPRALILAPTRELARQVQSEVEWLAPSLSSVCLYGGSAFGPQLAALRRGVDIVVGTPGRLVDHADKGTLDLSSLEICVLDEADEMLNVGFAKELEDILSRLPSKRQMLMFSATVPEWVQQVSRTHMTNASKIDLVGTEQIKTSDTIKHIAMMVQPAARLQILGDVLTVHGGDRAIVFVSTKVEADSLASSNLIRDDCCVLHGDINQAGREIALAGFRSGRYRNLIATDVAARGIDIPDVDLIVQYTMPARGNVETYIHRSGRTGRAGKSGTSIVFYTERDKTLLGMVERSIGVEIDRVGPPHLNDVLAAASKRVRAKLLSTPSNLVDQFVPEAERYLAVIEEGESNVTRAVAAALARIAGYNAPVTEKSILSYKEGNTAVIIEPADGASHPESFLGRNSVQDMVLRSLAHLDEIPRIGRIVAYQGGAVFDIPSGFASVFEEGGLKSREYTARIATSLPDGALAAMLDADGGHRDSGPRGRRQSSFSGRWKGRGGGSDPWSGSGGRGSSGRFSEGRGSSGRFSEGRGSSGRFSEGRRGGRDSNRRGSGDDDFEFPQFERRRGGIQGGRYGSQRGPAGGRSRY